MGPLRDMEMVVVTEQDRQTGDIGFIHKAQKKQWSGQKKKNGYSPMAASSDEDIAIELKAPLADAENAQGSLDLPAPAESESCGCLGKLCRKGCNEVQIACDRAVDSWVVFLDELAQMRQTLWMAVGSLVQWGLPAIGVIFSIAAQTLSARLATLYYIRYMSRLDDLVKQQHGVVDPLGSDWIYREHHDYPQKLQDIVASFMDPVEVPAYVWDFTLFPITLICLCLIIIKSDVYMWTKICVCFTFLNLGRAICHVSTVVPDAQGWESCKERLTNFGSQPDALKEMSEVVIDWRKGPIDSAFHIIQAEAKGMRYCGDMIYSGQTFVLVLFSLGLIQVLRKGWPEHTKTRFLVQFLSPIVIAVASVGVLVSRYHYTIDVFLALVLTVLWYDSATVASICEWWESIVDRTKERKVFVPDRQTAPKLSAAGLCFGSLTYLLELVVTANVAWEFYFTQEKQDIAMIYIGAMSGVSFVLVMFSIYMFQTDEDLSQLPICVRFPAALVLGSTHTVYLVTQLLSYKRKRLTDETFIIKVFKASLQSAPLACVQLHSLVMQQYETESTMLVSKKYLIYKRYAQMVISFYSLGEAVALFDSMRSSCLEQLLRNALWRTLLCIMRMSEVASRISAVVVFHCFVETRFGINWGAPALIGIDFLLAAIFARCLGVAKKCLSVGFLAMISLTSNVYLFQKDEDRRRLSDVLLLGRTAELFVFCAAVVWYFKFLPGGMHEILLFVGSHQGAIVILATSLGVYLINLAVWLEIRRVQLPREWDDQSVPVEDD